MKKTLFLFLILLSLNAFAQSGSEVLPLPDSLVERLKENRETNVARTKALNGIIMFYYDKHRILEAESYINDLSELAKELKDSYWKAISDYYSALCDLEKKNYTKAIVELNNVLTQVETLRLTDRTRLLLGRIYLAKSSYYKDMNMFPEGYDAIQKGLDVLGESHTAVRSRLLNNLGVIYDEMKNYDAGIAALKEALRGEKVAMYYENIASAYDGKESYDSALIYIDSALLVSNSLFDSLVITHFEGGVYSRLGDFDKAEQVFEECLEKTRFGPEFLYINSLIHQNSSSIAAKKSDYPKALRLAEKSIKFSDTLQDDNRLAICIKQKANILNSMHDYQNAITCMLEYDSIRNVVLMLQDKDKVNEIIHQKETRMLEQQYETERKIIKQRQQYIVIITILVIVFVAVIVFFLIKDKRQKEALLQQKLDLRNREITSKTMGQMQTNEVLTEVIEKLTHLGNNPKANENNLPMIIRDLKGMIDDGSKKDFDYYFVQVHPDFYTHLKQDFPNLTINELRLCALVKANLNIKEIANLNNVSIDSVKSSRKRLRKSLGISDPNVDLGEFLSKY